MNDWQLEAKLQSQHYYRYVSKLVDHKWTRTKA